MTVSMASSRGRVSSAFSSGFGSTAIAFFFGHIVEQSTWFATALFAYERSGTKTAGIISAIILVLAGLSAPFQARWLDRYEPFGAARALLGTQVIAAIVLIGSATLVDSDIALWAAAAAFACLQTCTVPVMSAILPSVARGGEALAAQNAIFGWVESAGLIAGPLLAAVVLQLSETTRDGLVTIAALSMVLVVVSIGLLQRFATQERSRSSSNRLSNDPSAIDARPTASAKRRVLALQIPALRTMAVLTFCSFLTLGALEVLYMPVAARSGLSEDKAGVLAAAYGAGGLLSYFATRLIVGRRRLTPAFAAAGPWVARYRRPRVHINKRPRHALHRGVFGCKPIGVWCGSTNPRAAVCPGRHHLASHEPIPSHRHLGGRIRGAHSLARRIDHPSLCGDCRDLASGLLGDEYETVSS
jgi:hypothetical protein